MKYREPGQQRTPHYAPVQPRPENVRVERVEVVRSTAGWTPELVEWIRAGNVVVWR